MKTHTEWFYAVMTFLGVVVPWSFNLEWMQIAPSTSALQFITDAMVNPASSSLTVDILIVFTTFSVWCLVEARRIGMKRAWLLIPYGGFVALASAFPLFLLLRSRRLRALESGRDPGAS